MKNVKEEEKEKVELLLTKEEVAEILNVHERTIDRYREKGRLKWVWEDDGKKNKVLIRGEDLQEFIWSETIQGEVKNPLHMSFERDILKKTNTNTPNTHIEEPCKRNKKEETASTSPEN